MEIPTRSNESETRAKTFEQKTKRRNRQTLRSYCTKDSYTIGKQRQYYTTEQKRHKSNHIRKLRQQRLFLFLKTSKKIQRNNPIFL